MTDPRPPDDQCNHASSSPPTDLVNIVLFAQRVKDDVDLIEHVHHLHRRDVDADLIELDHVAEQDGDVWEDLRFEKW